jgi:hypothetical protein
MTRPVTRIALDHFQAMLRFVVRGAFGLAAMIIILFHKTDIISNI